MRYNAFRRVNNEKGLIILIYVFDNNNTKLEHIY